jgi:EAL and modified HD-GYP domain-containing signal transduction protein
MDKEDILLARQPIYDTHKEIVAYELLFRSNSQIEQGRFDGNMATSNVLLNLFTEGDFDAITGGSPAFINFTEELIKSPPPLDPKKVVIEVLEDIEITAQLVANIKHLKHLGYTIALDDFVMAERYAPLLPFADIIKLELPAMSRTELQQTVESLRPFAVRLLAEKIETPEMFGVCQQLGCDLFQGFFLSKPEIITGRKIPDNKLVILNLIAELQNPDTEIKDLTRIIKGDPALSFKLLKLINSAAFGASRNVESIQHAVTLLGLERIKSWASLLALQNIQDKPVALNQIALIRAITCEQLARYLAPGKAPLFYTAGLFSCLAAFFDTELGEIISKIPLHGEVKSALLEYSGAAGMALKTAIFFEESRWNEVPWAALNKQGVNATVLNTLYHQSIDRARTSLESSGQTQ